MAFYVVKRLLWAIALVFAVTVVTFVLFFVIPTEPGRIGQGRSSEAIDLRNSLGIRGPIYEEYGEFVWKLAHGSLGESWVLRKDVNDQMRAAIPVTLSLVLGGALIWLLIAFPVGILAAYKPRSLLDRAATVFVLVGLSIHPVWIGLILSYYLGEKLRWFPLGGYCDLITPTTRCGGPVQWAYYLLLPWLTFGLLYAAFYMRMVRASVLDTKNEDFVRTARAKGASEWRILHSHVLRNALLPVVTMLGMDLGVWLTSAIFVERVFGLPGVGSLLYTSVRRNDLPIVVAVFLFIAVMVVIFNLIVDLLYTRLDPRIRYDQADFEGSVKTKTREDQAPAPAAAPI